LPPAKPEQIPQQIGGYYQDDGPIMAVPYDLDALPEPVPKDEPLNRFANKPYTALGQTYSPLNPKAPFTEEGMASWYGRKFHGKNTASGEQYDMFKLTAAHPTLPIPSYARVTNLENGKSVIVRVNDRGPFKKSRVMDMSYAAAYRLGYNNKGSARVRIEAITPGMDVASLTGIAPPVAPQTPPLWQVEEDPIQAIAEATQPTPPSLTPTPALLTAALPAGPVKQPDTVPAPTPTQAAEPAAVTQPVTTDATPEATAGPTVANVWLQVAAFGSQAAADAFRAKIAAAWDSNAPQPAVLPSGKVWRVRIGPFTSTAEASQAATRVATTFAVHPVVVH
jgi:rare lipoprotein A